ncbi:MAG: Gfo/Idh/MocA family oxidoreductase [Candidatus Omnitrophota bacterium]
MKAVSIVVKEWLQEIMMKNNRREFMKKSTQNAALASVLVSIGSHSILGANERIRLGGIGVGDRGQDRLRAAMKFNAEAVALCDVNQLMLEQAREKLGGTAELYKEHEKLLERNDIDAVVLATPDHWHHDIFLDAMAAEKDAYQEKPLSHTIEEGASMVKAAKKTDRVVQIGNHRRSGTHWHEAFKAIKEGVIGEVKWVRTYDCRNFSNGDPYQIRGRNKALYDPEKIDWKRFLGKAPQKPYSSDRASAWRWFWDYAGGLLTDIGAHNIDVAMWMSDCLDIQSVVSNGGVYHLDFWETPDVAHTTMDCGTFSIDFSVQFLNGYDGYGHSIFGTKGAVIQSDQDNFVRIYSQDDRSKSIAEWEMNNEGDAHMANFLDCVKSRAKTNSPIETANRVITACQLSNMAYRLNKKIYWDAQKNRIHPAS